MRKLLLPLVLFLVVQASLIFAATSSLEETVVNSQQAQTGTMNNADVVSMLEAGLSPDIVVAKIKSSACKFDTSSTALQQLKSARVPDTVIMAMVQAPVNASSSANVDSLIAAPKDDPSTNVSRDNKRDWKIGKVLDTDGERFTTYGGTNTQGRVDDNGSFSSTTTRSSWNHRREMTAIEGDQYIYVV